VRTGLLDMRECANGRFASIHDAMLRFDRLQQPRWFRPLLTRSARLQGWTGYNHWSRAWEYPWAVLAAAVDELPQRILDVGGGGSPFSHYMAHLGIESHVADPSLDLGSSFVFDAQKSLLQNVRSVTKRVLFRALGINALWGLPERGATSMVHYVPCRAEALTFPERQFDRVFCLSVMEHIPLESWGGCMREFERVLRPGGRLVITLDMTTPEADERRYLRLVESCTLQLIGDPHYEVPLHAEEQSRRHPGHGYETIGLLWIKPPE
jgi:2-polyprenyl-3-methyl-5-hydroxy-6-metoxy-1,4-benzoquinol methylase